MKIDIVTDTFAPDVNEVAMTLGRLTEGLKARGHRVHVIHTGEVAGPGETEGWIRISITPPSVARFSARNGARRLDLPSP